MKFSLFLTLFVFFFGGLATSLAATDIGLECRQFFPESKTRNGYLAEVAKMHLGGPMVIENFDLYLRDNLGDSFVDQVRSNQVDFVTIGLGSGPEALQESRNLGYTLGDKVEKRVGFHQIRSVTDSKGQKGFLIYRVNGHDREVHIESFIKWLKLPSEKLRTIGKHHNWTHDLVEFFKTMGPKPDLAIYGFAEATLLGMLQKHPLAHAKLFFKAYESLKPNKAPLLDTDPDLKGRPVQILELADGRRVWLFKNMYGDLAGELMHALSQYGVKNFLVYGTAGALNENFRIGDMMTPAYVTSPDSQPTEIPNLYPLAGVPQTGIYERVSTNNDQTSEWMADAVKRKIDLVEVEFGHILKWHALNPQLRLATMLVISEVMIGPNKQDMTEWNSDDIKPLRPKFVEFAAQMLGLTERDLKIKDIQTAKYPGKNSK